MKTYKCPLCDSVLSEDRYLKVLGAWQEKAKIEKEFKNKLKEAEEQKRQLLNEAKTIKKEINREKKRIAEERIHFKSKIEKEYKKKLKEQEKEAVQRGKRLEKQRANNLAKQLELKMETIGAMSRKIKELKDRLKRGTTSQMEGIDFEKLVVKELADRFPEDRIEPHGKKGDILQVVCCKKKEFGKILYECKKTDKFATHFIRQTKIAVAQRQATFGVLVTAAFKKDTEGFFVEKDIIVVHPFGVCYIAQILRNSIIELAHARSSKKEIDKKAKNLMDYISGDEFRSLANDAIYRARLLGDILNKEVKTHANIWKERFDHYKSIHDNIITLDSNTKGVLKGEKIQKICASSKLIKPPMLLELIK